MSKRKIFGIAGFKNAGKTTLIVDLIKEYRSRGLRVATVKHAHHEFDIDQPGKDSFQHREAGAEEVIIASSRRWAHVCELHSSTEPPLQELLSHLGDVDIVLIEGYKHGNHPRLELRRAGVDAPLLAGTHPEFRAIVADTDLPDETLPVLPRSSVARIADFILAYAGVA
jgi:molybdopterin-guanine dinucleotide biosynthesis protein B